MRSTFCSHLSTAHRYWKEHLAHPEHQGSWAIDATCGNGHDTLILAELIIPLQGGVIGLDIQADALQKTAEWLKPRFSELDYARINLFHHSHETFPALAYQNPISLIVYNLGYLPGGDKTKTTQTTTTLCSLKAAISLITKSGILSITCYPGHPEGKNEQEAILQWAQSLDKQSFTVFYHQWLNRITAPSLFIIQKN